ncbi:MAG: hypothetical protein EOO61_02275 [Hymenobacter sp.]|nr:MAG: hypothetical protein EOO61_02275 [Hymenobacter sp.]
MRQHSLEESNLLRSKLLALYKVFPFQRHPLWVSIKNGQLSKEQVLLAEGQHYLRTKAGQLLRKAAVKEAEAIPELHDAIYQTYLEECTDETGTDNHLALIKRLLTENGLSITELESLQNTPGNIAAIALYSHIGQRGVGLHIIGAGVVEYYYSQLSGDVFNVYTNRYGISPFAAETYRLHGPMDAEHAARALDVIPLLKKMYGEQAVASAVRDAFVATSLHYDGMLQAATGKCEYWDGKY